MFCEKCGAQLQDTDNICPVCSYQINYSPNIVTPSIKQEASTTDFMRCKKCGMDIAEGEKFCIKCGTPVVNSSSKKHSDNIDETPLQTELCKILNLNKFLGFIFKYSFIFAYLYPIYVLLGRFAATSEIYKVLSDYSIIIFYFSNIGYLSMYADKKFKGLYGALALRLISSVIPIFDVSFPLPYIFRTVMIILIALFIYKYLMTDKQRKNLLNKTVSLNIAPPEETTVCKVCGKTLSKDDSFCSGCGNKM